MLIKEFIEHLEDQVSESKKSQKGKFTKDEVTRVFFGPPKGAPPPGEGKQPPPPPEPDREIEVITKSPKDKEVSSKSKPSDKVKVKDIRDKEEDCKECGGTGKKDGKPCEACGGTGKESGESKESDKGYSVTKETVKPKKGAPGKASKPHPLDSHDILGKSDKSEAKDMAKKIFEAAEKKREEKTGEKQWGSEAGHFTDKLREIYKPRIDWVKELKKKLNAFKSVTAQSIAQWNIKVGKYKEGVGTAKSKSFVTGLKDPRSHGQLPSKEMLFRGPYVKAPIIEIILFVCLDVSGSIPNSTLGKVFGEMDKIAKNFQSGISTAGLQLKGKVYFIPWDTEVKEGGVTVYKSGDYKKYMTGEKKIPNLGGTDVTCIFEFINKRLLRKEESKNHAVLNVIKKPTATGISGEDIPIKFIKKGDSYRPVSIPFLIIATDGAFSKPTDSDFKTLYESPEAKKNILYLVIDGTTKNCYPANIIEYESFKI